MSRKQPSGRRKRRLPGLAFGNQNPQKDTSAKAMSERVQSAMPWELEYRALGDGRDFEHQLASVSINGMRVTATASTPISVHVEDARDMSLMVPLAGNCTTGFDGRIYEWGAGHSACLIPKAGRGGGSEERSVLMLDIDPHRLRHTWQIMSGNSAATLADLEATQLMSLNVAGFDFTQAFRHVGGLIDALNGDQKLLDKSGIDDLIYRLTVMLMRPDAFVDSAALPLAASNGFRFDQLCEYIAANLGNRITMTELEMLSGCSSRTLQYQFKHRFGCSPMRWITLQRLEACRARFTKRKSGDTVTSVALTFGFSNLGNFARLYADLFGERPSETMAQAKSR